MVVRDGRCIAAHFGSPTSETAVCLSTVGIADRSDRTTFELRGAPSDIDAAIASLPPPGAPVSWARTGSRSAIVRCEHTDTAACSAALLGADVAIEISNRFAAIEVIGPRASELLRAVDVHRPGTDVVVLENRATSYELLIDAETGSALWGRLLDAGAPLRVACVGLEALEHLAVSQHLARSASHPVP
jgi:hypothetical protein